MPQTFRFDSYKVPEKLEDFDPYDFIAKAGDWVEEHVEPGHVVAVSASGGVDSTVAAYLLLKAVGGDGIYPFFLDDGCRRVINGKPEGEVTQDIFGGFKNFRLLNVAPEIKPKIIGLSDGEEKRKAFIAAYRGVSNNHITGINARWIADGTIGPDIKETEGRVKTQHNVGWNYATDKLEPLATLWKPQVRKVGTALGLPDAFVHRIPCPGPAQILRVVGEFTEEKLRRAQVATDIVEQEVEKYYTKTTGKPYSYDPKTGVRTPFQYFGAILDSGMRVHGGLTELAKRILGQNATGFEMKAQTTINLEGGKRPEKPTYRPVAWLETDGDVGYDKLEALSKAAWNEYQLPRILWRVRTGHGSGFYAAAIRVIDSTTVVQTRHADINYGCLKEMGEKIGSAANVAHVAYDISHKPPATVEFE